MRWNRKEYVDLLTGRDSSRQMFVELFGLLVGLPEEWEAQGATQEQLSLEWFAFDHMEVQTVGGLGMLNPPPEVVLEETEEYRIIRDSLGRTSKMIKATATLPLPLDFPVKTMDDWIKMKHYFAFSEERLALTDVEYLAARQKEGAIIAAGIPGGFDVLRELMGEENACLAYYDQPELVEDILGTVSNTNTRVLDYLSGHFVIDQLSVHEDMAGKSGPLIGPATIETFIKPYYRATWDLLHARGTELFCQDSDGNMMPVMDAFIDAGVNVFYPCEPAAGMDIVALREKYGPAIAYKGGIDKHVLRQDKVAIRRELEYKMQPFMQQGGVVFGLDHRIPNGTPLENYIYYVKTARELLHMPPLEEVEKGWDRMAF
ncbi:MAG: uroporphyrinogen decarboxylase family protein [Oscillospiraceae bacterium]